MSVGLLDKGDRTPQNDRNTDINYRYQLWGEREPVRWSGQGRLL